MRPLRFAVLLALSASCSQPSATPSQSSSVAGDASTQGRSLTGNDIRDALESDLGLHVGLRTQTFADQAEVPLQVDGVVVDGPTMLFGKPVVRTTDYIKASIDSWPSTSILFSLIDDAGGMARVRVSRCWGTGSSNAEAWITHDGGAWRVVEIVWAMNSL